MSFKTVTHVIFDMDGLVLESESGYEKVISEIAKPFGQVYTKEMQMKILGTPERETARIAIEEMQLPYTIDEFVAMFRPKVREVLQHPPLMPGARELIEHLHKHNVPLAVATSSSQDLTAIKMQDYQDLYRMFHHLVCGSTDPEVKRGKPAPDIFQVCASRFPDRPQPEQCLVLEDAPNGAQGAAAAEMQVVLVPAPEIPDEKRKHATLVLKSLKEFKPELFGLPPFD